MTPAKILFLDIDDTLLTRSKEITPEVRDAIERALKAGHKIVIATGRTLPAVRSVLDRLDLARPGCFCITGNGSSIFDCGDMTAICDYTLSLEDAKYVMGEALKEGLHIQTYDRGDVVSKYDDEEIRFYTGRLKVPYRVDPELPDSMTVEPNKLLAIELHDHKRLEAFRERMTKWANGRLSFFFSNPWYLEVVREGISKGNAVRFLADYLNIPIENTVSAGDMENDIPMLEAAHIGCAMANALPEVKAAADYITERDCDHSGVAEIIEKFILNT